MRPGPSNGMQHAGSAAVNQAFHRGPAASGENMTGAFDIASPEFRLMGAAELVVSGEMVHVSHSPTGPVHYVGVGDFTLDEFELGSEQGFGFPDRPDQQAQGGPIPT